MPVRFTPIDNSAAAKPASKVRFTPRAPAAPQRQPYTELESVGMGAAQGASLGFADEIAGGLGAAKEVAFGPTKLSQLVDRYKELRDQKRGQFEAARQDNPASFTGGEIGGSVAGALIPGMGWMRAGTTLGKLGTAAGIGALQGVGTSNAENPESLAEDAAVGAALGAGTQGVLSGAGAAIKSIPRIPHKLANILMNTPEEITDTYVTEGIKAAKTGGINPVLTAPRRFELAREFEEQGLDPLKKLVSEGSAESREILRREGQSISGDELAKIYHDAADDIIRRSEGVMTDPQHVATVKWLQETGEKFKSPDGTPRMLSTNRVKDELQTLDRAVDYDIGAGRFGKIDDQVKKGIRQKVDTRVKDISPAYREQMKQVAPDAELLSEATAVAKSPERMANVFRRIETDQYGAGQLPRDVLSQVDARLGTSFLEKARLSNTREAFDKSITNGSMNVNKFSNMLKDVPGLRYVAPLMGATVDKYGRKMTMGAVDAAVSVGKILQSEGPQSFINAARPIMEAARKGNASAVLTMQFLSQSNPEAMKYLEENNP